MKAALVAGKGLFQELKALFSGTLRRREFPQRIHYFELGCSSKDHDEAIPDQVLLYCKL